MRSLDPRQPIDLGLPSLGLVMRLVAALATALGVVIVALATTLNDALGAGGGPAPAIGLVALGVGRAWMQGSAGAALIARSPDAPRLTTRYLATAILTTLAMVPLAALTFPTAPALAIAVGLGATMLWPVAVTLWVRRRAVREMFAAARAFDVGLVPKDRSIEGVGVTMLVLAPMGLGIAFLLMIAAIGGGDLPMGLVAATFIARSSAHLRVGQLAAGGTPPWVFPHAIGRYNGLAWLSVVAVAVWLLARGGGNIHPVTIVLLLAAVLGLIAWPRIVVGFADRALAEERTLGAMPTGAAPDRGLVSLGSLLLALSVAEITGWLVEIALTESLPAAVRSRAFVDASDAALTLAPVALKIWAAVALVRMRGYRVAVLIYGVVAIAATIVGWAITPIGVTGLLGAPLVLVGVGVNLAVPIAAIVLSRRTLPPEELVLRELAEPVAPAVVARAQRAEPKLTSAPPPERRVAAPRPALAVKSPPRTATPQDQDVIATLVCACGWREDVPRVFATPRACPACGAQATLTG